MHKVLVTVYGSEAVYCVHVFKWSEIPKRDIWSLAVIQERYMSEVKTVNSEFNIQMLGRLLTCILIVKL